MSFPVTRSKYGRNLRAVGFDQKIPGPDLRDTLARRVLNAALQPVSAFMNSLRTRTSPISRAGGRSARSGPSYINAASFNPAVLVAILNIYRVYHNRFEPRQYVGSGSETSEVEKGSSSVRLERGRPDPEAPCDRPGDANPCHAPRRGYAPGPGAGPSPSALPPLAPPRDAPVEEVRDTPIAT